MITRPVRERSITGIGEMVEQGLEATGFEEVGLLSLSSADHSEIAEIAKGLADRYEGTQTWPVAALDPGRRLQHRPGQRADPQRPPLRPDLRARGRHRADPQGDQQDGHRGGPDPHGHRGVRRRLAAGEALLHVRPAHRDRRGRAADRRPGPRGDPHRPRGHRHAATSAARCPSAASCPSRTRRSSGPRSSTTRRPTPGWPSCATPSAPTASSPRHRLPLPRRQARHRRGTALARRPPRRRGHRAGLARRAAASTAGASTSPTTAGWPPPTALAGTGVDVDWYTTRERDHAEVLPWDHLDSGLDKDWLWEDWQDASISEVEVEDCRWTPCFDCGVCPQMDTEIQIGPTGKNCCRSRCCPACRRPGSSPDDAPAGA